MSENRRGLSKTGKVKSHTPKQWHRGLSKTGKVKSHTPKQWCCGLKTSDTRKTGRAHKRKLHNKRFVMKINGNKNGGVH